VSAQLQHDAAVAMAKSILEIIGDCLREEEHRDAFEEFYRVCREGIETYSLHKDWLELKIELGSE